MEEQKIPEFKMGNIIPASRTYSIIFHMSGGSAFKSVASLTDKQLEIFKNTFSSESTTQWTQQILPQMTCLINLANINMVEISPIPILKHAEERITEEVKSTEKENNPGQKEKNTEDNQSVSKDAVKHEK